MIQAQTYLTVADNSGARKLMCIRVLGTNRPHYAGVGDIIIAVVKEALPNMPLKKSDIVRAVVVRTKKPTAMTSRKPKMMTLCAFPEWNDPTVTTAASSGSMRRLTMC